MPMTSLKRLVACVESRWREVALAIASASLAFVALDVGYRIWQYRTLPDRLYALIAPSFGNGQNSYVYDHHVGYRYPPNFEGSRGAPWHSRWRTNSHGHVAAFEYPRAKPDGEYRIAVIGDSFTANVTNNVRWTEVLEQELNHSPAWRDRVGRKSTRVINFGVDGMGMVQFALMVRHHALAFSPDMVIVNFVSDDLLRRLRFPEPSITGDDREQVLRANIQRRMIDPINWFRVYPELLAAAIAPRLGLVVGIPLSAKTILAAEPGMYFPDRQEALRASAVAAREIVEIHPKVVFLQAPQYHEIANEPIPQWDGLVARFQVAAPAAKVVSMLEPMRTLLEGKRKLGDEDFKGLTMHQILALPSEQWPEIYKWFFLPDDVHYTDYGTTLYAKQVARYLAEGPPLPELPRQR